MKVAKKIFNISATVFLIIATLLVIAVFVVRISGAKPKLFGYYFFNVVSDSMSPMLKIDDVILVKESDGTDIKNGDIISYHAEAGDMAGKDITHKVIKDPVKREDGTIVLETMGIKPGALVDPPITNDQVIGKYVMKLSVLSFIYKVFRQWYGLFIFLAVILAVIGKEIYNLRRLSEKSDKLDEALKELQEFENSQSNKTSKGSSEESDE